MSTPRRKNNFRVGWLYHPSSALESTGFQLAEVCSGIQNFEETPQYTEVNPGQDAKLICRVLGKRGLCIWQKDQKSVAIKIF
ncbi:hypothetical protein PV327_008542 [Microctonus hyperodae]|uniref:Ig-like domain-containing protein n=1 Tax=Microctonus hyperodae TaxID=165561 RepID=A0AA39KHF9_MICHY|nr:hypothetical protein PV327_008542 [Microctonus hyperodae]